MQLKAAARRGLLLLIDGADLHCDKHTHTHTHTSHFILLSLASLADAQFWRRVIDLTRSKIEAAAISGTLVRFIIQERSSRCASRRSHVSVSSSSPF